MVAYAGLVLVADDSATVRAIVRLELEAAGFAVLEAADGQQALAVVRDAAARGGLPDAVLLDIEMPVLDGYAVLDALKADPATAAVPVVFLTGRGGTTEIVRALRAGAHDHVSKPPEPAELLARVTSAVRIKALQDELRRRADELDLLSRTDALTGLYNRRHGQESLRSLAAGSCRHGYPLAVLIADVDHFKRVNDSAGHAAGDAVLQAVAARLREALRLEDVLARWGGEEFLVLCPYTDAASVAVLAERLRVAVAGLQVAVPTPGDPGRTLGVTVSIGGAATVGGADGPADGGADLLVLADRQLYAAKDSGRDRVRLTG